MHSSRIRTACLLTVSPHALCRGGCLIRGCLPWGLSAQGSLPRGCLPRVGVSAPGGVCLGDCLPRGLYPGDVCPGCLTGECLPQRVSAQRCVANTHNPPPRAVNGMIDRQVSKNYLAATSLRVVSIR